MFRREKDAEIEGENEKKTIVHNIIFVRVQFVLELTLRHDGYIDKERERDRRRNRGKMRASIVHYILLDRLQLVLQLALRPVDLCLESGRKCLGEIKTAI